MTNFVTKPLKCNYGDYFSSDDTVEPKMLSYRLNQTRNELNNIRKELKSMKAQHQGDIEKLENLCFSTGMLDNLRSSKFLSMSTLKQRNLNPILDRNSEVYCPNKTSAGNTYLMKPIGFIRSLHHQKNGTPRQGSVLPLSRGRLEIEKDVFNNPSHSLDGLDGFSHVWIIYFFNQNTGKATHSKVSPPRLDGKKVGVYSTRSPHRPNGIGLTLAKLDKHEGNCIQLSGIDILDGTPVLDIKPYIPQYDNPAIPPLHETKDISNTDKLICEIEVTDHCKEKDQNLSSNILINNFVSFNDHILPKISHHSKDLQNLTVIDNKTMSTTVSNFSVLGESDIVKEDSQKNISECIAHQPNINNFCDSKMLNLSLHDYSDCNSNGDSEVTVASWLHSPPISGLEVIFNQIAEEQIKQFSSDADDPNFRLEYLKSPYELRRAILSVLSEDPRSTYRRQKCQDRLYFFMVDTAHITSWFIQGIAEVLRVHPPSEATSCFKRV